MQATRQDTRDAAQIAKHSALSAAHDEGRMNAMKTTLQSIPEYSDVDDATFKRDIATQYRPAVLRGFVKHWPAVKQAIDSPEAICQYLMALDSGKTVDVLLLAPETRGRVFYQPDLNGFNFIRNLLPISAVIEQIVRYSHFEHPPSVAVQSALIADCLPGFGEDNKLTALDASVQPRIWMGNSIATPAHIDESNNIACVVAGKRRFTLFPPEQVGNLYLGPVDYTPTGSPISMVDFSVPDFDRFPRFRDALAAGFAAELEPGDAIFIPTLWWHHVASLRDLNILVNYWWKASASVAASRTSPGSAYDCLMHCLLNMRDMPPEQRAGWKAIFDHFVFDPKPGLAAHIPENRHGLLGDFSPEHAREIREWLERRLKA